MRHPIIRYLILATVLTIVFSVLSFFSSMKMQDAYAAVATSITSPVDGQALNVTSPVIQGTTTSNTTVKVYIDNALSGTATADVNGDWNYYTSGLSEGTHNVYAQTQDGTETSATVTFQIDVTAPTITITNPTSGDYTNLPFIEGKTEPGLSVTIYVYGFEKTVTADVVGDWSCLITGLPEGNHNTYATTIDNAGNVGTSPVQSFILDMTRPTVLTDLYPPDEMTTIPVNIITKVYLKDNYEIDPNLFQNAFKLEDRSGNQVVGTVYNSVYSDIYGQQYELSFEPDSPLSPGMTYTALIDPVLTDKAGNYVYSRQWSFTTETGNYSIDVHGNYMSNVNTCIKCHNTHRSASPKLIKPEQNNSMDDFCNACHDGTAAPVPNKWPENHRHDFQMSIDGTVGTSSCAGCHDPHLNWSFENPNLLQDYFYHQHSNPDIPDTSEKQLCESCHPADIKDDPNTAYKVYNYNKANTTKGTKDDYSLCLRCHDGSNAVNISVYYSDAASGHIISEPVPDGSPINGHLACADCHETHGSANIKMLKSKLGQRNAQTFTATGTTWDATTERQFCTSCHNNNTELYGVVANFVYTTSGHEAGNTQACSDCHGGSPIAAAHAPK